MGSPPIIRGLRIAFSAVSGLVAILLICLWVRSYSDYATLDWSLDGDYVLRALHQSGTVLVLHKRIKPYQVGRYLVQENWMTLLKLPYWALALTVAAFGYLPWIPIKRFTTRTLLVATTLVAVVLGVVVWSRR